MPNATIARVIASSLRPESDGAAEIAKRYIRYGPSPRGAQSIVTIGKAHALLAGRYNLSKDDLHRAAKSALRHRIILNFEAEADGITTDRVLDDVLEFAERMDKDPIGV